jgi:uncharacterized protein (TIGR02996 family)
VYAAPHDDGPRAVLADALIEANDPRGELIVLQLARHRGRRTNAKREAMLLRHGGRDWDGGIVGDGGHVQAFARGFPVAAWSGKRGFAAPGWATIEALSLGGFDRFAGAPVLRALRYLHGLRGEDLATAELGELDFVSVVAFDVAQLGGPARVAPAELELQPPQRVGLASALRVALAGPIGRRVRVVYAPGSSLAGAVALLAAPQLVEIRVARGADPYVARPSPWTAVVQRGELRIAWHGAGDPSWVVNWAHGHTFARVVLTGFDADAAAAIESATNVGRAAAPKALRRSIERAVQVPGTRR